MGAGDRGCAKTKKGIRNGPDAIDAMEAKAHLRKARRDGGRMRAVLLAALNRFMRDEPGVAPAAQVVGRRAPPGNVRFILVFHPDRLAAERRVTRRA